MRLFSCFFKFNYIGLGKNWPCPPALLLCAACDQGRPRPLLTGLQRNHHPGLQREGSGDVWSVVDVHAKVVANVVRAVFSSSLEMINATELLEQ